MSMLDLITKASANIPDHHSLDSQYPILLNPDPIFLSLKPPQSNDVSFPKPVQGWKISQLDADVIEFSQKFCDNLKIKAKNPESFTKNEFISMLNDYLGMNVARIGISIGVDPDDDGYTKLLIQKVGFLMGDAVLGLVLEACFDFELWEILEALFVGGLIHGSCSKNLVSNLIEKRLSGLICLCVKYVNDLQVSDILSVLKYILSPPKDAYATMVLVRKEWESWAVSAIDMALDKSLGEKKLNLAKDAAVLLMMAYDEFTTSELCLHYLLASPNIDDAILSACIGKLNGSEIMGLVRYLNKWLGKYQKFPQACSSPKALAFSAHGLKAFESVPLLEHVTKCFGLVIDEHFSSLVMLPEFREEVKSIELVVSSLASEARLCCTLANLAAMLKN